MNRLKKLNITLQYKVGDNEYDYELCGGTENKLNFKKIRPNNVYRYYNDEFTKDEDNDKDPMSQMKELFENDFNLNLPSSSIFLPKLEDINSILLKEKTDLIEAPKRFDHIKILNFLNTLYATIGVEKENLLNSIDEFTKITEFVENLHIKPRGNEYDNHDVRKLIRITTNDDIKNTIGLLLLYNNDLFYYDDAVSSFSKIKIEILQDDASNDPIINILKFFSKLHQIFYLVDEQKYLFYLIYQILNPSNDEFWKKNSELIEKKNIDNFINKPESRKIIYTLQKKTYEFNKINNVLIQLLKDDPNNDFFTTPSKYIQKKTIITVKIQNDTIKKWLKAYEELLHKPATTLFQDSTTKQENLITWHDKFIAHINIKPLTKEILEILNRDIVKILPTFLLLFIDSVDKFINTINKGYELVSESPQPYENLFFYISQFHSLTNVFANLAYFEESKYEQFFYNDNYAHRSDVIKQIMKILSALYKKTKFIIDKKAKDETSRKYIDKPWSLFINNFDGNTSHVDLPNLFTKFQEEYLEAYENQADTTRDRRGYYGHSDEKKIPDYITKRKQKDIFKKYAKFFNEKIDDKELEAKFGTDNDYREKVISYYNVYYLLTNIFLPKDTIIVDDFYDSVLDKEVPKYIKVKSIEPMLQLAHIKTITRDQISCYFKLTFEPVSTYNKLRFNISIFDREKFNFKDKYDIPKKTSDATVADTGLHKLQKYKDYTNDIFLTRNKKSSTELYFDEKVNLNKIVTNYDKLRKFNAKTLTYKIKNEYEFFIFQFLFAMIDPNNNSEYKIKENVSQEYYKYLIDNIFFKLNSTVYLKKFNSKKPYAVIQKVKINEQLTKKLNDRNNDSSKGTATTEASNNSATVKYPSNDLRLKIDGLDTRYNMYIDLHVLFKKTADEQIDMKTKIQSQLKCNYNATILDELFYRLLKYNYKKNFFSDGLTAFANMSSDKDEVPPAEALLLQDANKVLNKDANKDLNKDANKDLNKDANKDVRDERYRDYRYGNYGYDGDDMRDRFGDDMYGPRGGKKNNKRKMNINKYSIPKNKNKNKNKNNNLKKYKKQKYNSKKNRTFKNKKLSSSNTIKNLIKFYLKT